jgi:hypothetical protein
MMHTASEKLAIIRLVEDSELSVRSTEFSANDVGTGRKESRGYFLYCRH